MNVKNRTVFSNDNLLILRGLDTESVDLIYLDPPFNSNRNYAAPIGSEAAGAAFKDTWTLSDVDNAWHGEIAEREPSLYQAIHAAELIHGKGMKSYLIMMAVRLLEMKRVLKKSGSIYLHCDPTASHYLKVLMDAVFGNINFRNEIVWRKYGGHKNTAKLKFTTENDILFFYSTTNANAYTFNRVFRPLSEQTMKSEYRHVDENGRRYSIPRGRKYRQGVIKRVYLDTHPGVAIGNLWMEKELTMQGKDKERTGYPTQKPIALLERIIKASSNEGDIVLDPFCGCATTCVAAERLGRQWIGIDISEKAVDLVRVRLENEVGLFGHIIHRSDIPKRSEKTADYRTHKHTLYGKQEGLCNGCETQFPFRNMTVDHIIPKSQGGTDHEDNLQLLCGACNSTKGNHTQAELIARLKQQGVIKS